MSLPQRLEASFLGTYQNFQDESDLTESGRGFHPAASPVSTPQPFPVVVWGGLTAAVLDTLDALVAFGLLGKSRFKP